MNTILLVEDDDDDVMLFEDALQQVAPETKLVHANNGKAALEFLDGVKSGEPIKVFVDLNMPGMDGIACLEKIRLRKEFGEVPVFILTTSDSLATKLEGLRKGATDFFTKPHDYRELILILKKALGKQ